VREQRRGGGGGLPGGSKGSALLRIETKFFVFLFCPLRPGCGLLEETEKETACRSRRRRLAQKRF
jgi:hypothetical protein